MEEREPSILRPGGAAALPGSADPDEAPTEVSFRHAAEAPVVWAAGFWRRSAAALIDAAIVLPLVLAVIVSASKLAGLNLPAIRHGSIDTWLDLALGGDPAFLGGLGLGAAVIALYVFLFQSLVAHTIGMRVLRLTVIDLAGAPVSPWRAGLRTIGYLVCLATLGLGFLWVAFDREKRGLHDWLAGTLVTKPPPRGRNG